MSKALVTTGLIAAGGTVAIGVWAALATGGDADSTPSSVLSISTSSEPAPDRSTQRRAVVNPTPASTGLSYTDMAANKSKGWSAEDKQRFEELQLKHDLDGDGELNDEEKAAMWGEIKAYFQALRIAKFDKDGDGVLNEEEERAARLSDLLQSDYGQNLARKYDINRDGALNDAEVAALQAGLAQVKQTAIEKHDLDDSGTLDDLEQEIAKESYQERMERMKSGYSDRHDVDGNGELDASERAAAWAEFGAMYAQQRFVMGNDSNGDGIVNTSDLGDYMDRFNDHDPTADLNGDGAFNSADLDEFNRRINEGENTMPEGDDRLPDEWFVEGIDDKPMGDG